MNKRGLFLGCTLVALSFTPLAHAVDGISLEVGRSSESTDTYRLAAQFDFGTTLWQTQSQNVRLGGYWDAGVVRWSGLDTTSVGVSPVLRLEFGQGGAVTPYLELGIGAAYFTRSSINNGDPDLGSRFHFEDRLGAGLRFSGGSELGVRIYHYSNAGLKEPNQGIENASLFYRLPI
ncbi:acyloxyacyl hydrolase [Halopseudomonas nanhaiensis]|uniref:acyloxyacyl hydrolase n=1 Tax=Halopseudomonas nanhaiensis TaxID=2830842 RepID=UPI001CBD5927|nr:acyloxyacyl hydrolase [Halopseudomonas nanhaiensis]UAW97919.1 acyloxyacyl hydrolase [Halopseudomonas nanhaiensis]